MPHQAELHAHGVRCTAPSVAAYHTWHVYAGRMMELVLGILRNMLCFPRLAAALASHAALPRAVVECALCGCEDPVAVTTACGFLLEACSDYDYVKKEVRTSYQLELVDSKPYCNLCIASGLTGISTSQRRSDGYSLRTLYSGLGNPLTRLAR